MTTEAVRIHAVIMRPMIIAGTVMSFYMEATTTMQYRVIGRGTKL